MKQYGSKIEYERERGIDLLRNFRRLVEESQVVKIIDICGILVNMPSARFWVSEERAAIVLSSMMKGDKLDNMRPTKREMFNEIYRRAMLLKEKNPDMTIFELAFNVVRQPAPKFYLTAKTAKYLILCAKKRCYEETKKRIGHIF
jgi:hypothetical protein